MSVNTDPFLNMTYNTLADAGVTITHNHAQPVFTLNSPGMNNGYLGTTSIGSTSFTEPTYDALTVNGSLTVTGDISMDGMGIRSRLDKIEERLGILQLNGSLEGRWAALKELGDQYRAMEASLLDKEKVWDIIKK